MKCPCCFRGNVIAERCDRCGVAVRPADTVVTARPSQRVFRQTREPSPMRDYISTKEDHEA